MTRWLGWVAIALLLLLCGVALIAFGSAPRTASLNDRTIAVARELRCPVCQGESVADSPAGISVAMRAIIRHRLQRGQSSDQIKQYFVSRYGPRILLAPPSQGVGSMAWLAPPLLVLGGVSLLAILVLDWRARGRRPVTGVDPSYLRRVRSELEVESRLD